MQPVETNQNQAGQCDIKQKTGERVNGIFFEHVGTFEKIADENKEYESENFDETVHVTIPCLQFEVGIVRSEKLKYPIGSSGISGKTTLPYLP